MPISNAIPSTLLGKAAAVKVGSIFVPAMLVSFVGGMLVWRALQPKQDAVQLEAVQSELDSKLAALSAGNEQLQEGLRQLVEKIETSPEKLQQAETQSPQAVTPEKTPKSKLAMLKRVLDENIKLRKNA